VILHLHDHCRGIPVQALDVVFEPFHGSHPDKPVPGLGLSVARRIIQSEGGAITVEKGPEGCHFRITLPRGGRPRARE
jgi:signal transduction histidine kinase